ncbi:hypothetical protein CBP36_07325 [Acidovorax carolinensis]|uniref:Uncharacterized protein n=1 Tax=Acidovorax carolinensis TaxID=553814 RepID=A0A240UCB7_9BURK|nr:hypothetical protein CBP35_11610 [Acidovorax carolinensis]ART58689.1 hypothetical protein CBP36_07325 [Acidovorax carolinensis]
MKQGQGLSCADAIRGAFSNFSASDMSADCSGAVLAGDGAIQGRRPDMANVKQMKCLRANCHSSLADVQPGAAVLEQLPVPCQLCQLLPAESTVQLQQH